MFYCSLLLVIIIFVFTKDIKKHISPYQHSNNSRKELKELVQKVGFTVNHCSRRDMYYSECLDQYAGKSSH